jgi:succinyl-CoA synthetase alpha subunit
MSILINKNTRVMTQGITGKTTHTKMGKEYANGKLLRCRRQPENRVHRMKVFRFSRP